MSGQSSSSNVAISNDPPSSTWTTAWLIPQKPGPPWINECPVTRPAMRNKSLSIRGCNPHGIRWFCCPSKSLVILAVPVGGQWKHTLLTWIALVKSIKNHMKYIIVKVFHSGLKQSCVWHLSFAQHNIGRLERQHTNIPKFMCIPVWTTCMAKLMKCLLTPSPIARSPKDKNQTLFWGGTLYHTFKNFISIGYTVCVSLLNLLNFRSWRSNRQETVTGRHGYLPSLKQFLVIRHTYPSLEDRTGPQRL